VNRRLAPGDERCIDELEAFHSVRVAARLQRHERRHFRLVCGDDDFSAAEVGDTVHGAKLVHHAAALHRQARLERAGGIVDARVDDAAIVGARVEARTRMSFNHADGKTAACDGGGGGESGDAGADHGHIDPFQGAGS
jgi:hypothetical protein